MCIIFNEAGLKDLNSPCVAQQFINHNAELFKVIFPTNILRNERYNYVFQFPKINLNVAVDRFLSLEMSTIVLEDHQ